MATPATQGRMVSLFDADPDANNDPYPDATYVDKDRKAFLIVNATAFSIVHVAGPVAYTDKDKKDHNSWFITFEPDDTAPGMLEKMSLDAGYEGRDRTMQRIKEQCSNGNVVGPVKLQRQGTKGFLSFAAAD